MYCIVCTLEEEKVSPGVLDYRMVAIGTTSGREMMLPHVRYV